jgi:hyperosmotically inducible periplasmic protein
MRKVSWLILFSLFCLPAACSSGEDTATKDPATDKAPDADNTAKNADVNTPTETPTAQSESGPDIEISAAIRKAVVDDKALSVNAHNVKIVTSSGVVTLRGPVKSDAEKQSIEAKAKKVAGVTSVNNLLEVEQTK